MKSIDLCQLFRLSCDFCFITNQFSIHIVILAFFALYPKHNIAINIFNIS